MTPCATLRFVLLLTLATAIQAAVPMDHPGVSSITTLYKGQTGRPGFVVWINAEAPQPGAQLDVLVDGESIFPPIAIPPGARRGLLLPVHRAAPRLDREILIRLSAQSGPLTLHGVAVFPDPDPELEPEPRRIRTNRPVRSNR
jgi:hypothetical protein